MSKKPSFKEIKAILGPNWEVCFPDWQKMYCTSEMGGGCWYKDILYVKNLKTGEKLIYKIKDDLINKTKKLKKEKENVVLLAAITRCIARYGNAMLPSDMLCAVNAALEHIERQ